MNVGGLERALLIGAGAAAVAAGFTRGGAGGKASAAVGSLLILGGLRGPSQFSQAIEGSPGHESTPPARTRSALTVAGNPDEVYGAWRALERLPDFMRHIDEVVHLGDSRYRWTARLPGLDRRISWEAEVTQDDGSVLAWRSHPNEPLEVDGRVEITEAPGGRGAEIRASILYRPPAGEVGRLVARMLMTPLKSLVTEDIRRFKQWYEAGEVATVEGQPSARRGGSER